MVVAAWRPGIVAKWFRPINESEAARQLERVASDVGAGVVIAGAYGHSRLSEVDPRWRDAAAHQSSEPLLPAVTLDLISIK